MEKPGAPTRRPTFPSECGRKRMIQGVPGLRGANVRARSWKV
jgi:hypothetical protein